MFDIPPAVSALFESSMPLRVPGWEELPLGGGSSNLQSTWLEGNDLKATAPTMSQEAALLFVIDGQPMIVRLKASSEGRQQAPQFSVLSVPERLDTIKTKLGISVTQLADLFGVTRKTIYDWYEGKGPRAPMEARIDSLLESLTEFDDSDLKKLKSVWNIDLNGGSFRSALQSDTLSRSDLTAALVVKLNELSAEISAISRSSRRATPAYIGESSLADIERRSDSY